MGQKGQAQFMGGVFTLMLKMCPINTKDSEQNSLEKQIAWKAWWALSAHAGFATVFQKGYTIKLGWFLKQMTGRTSGT